MDGAEMLNWWGKFLLSMEERETIMMRKAFSLFVLGWLMGVYSSFAATNALLYSDTFENYTNGMPLVDGTNYWYSSTVEGRVATVLSNASLAAAGSTNVAAIPADVTLSNRYAATTSTNVWLHMQSRVVYYDGLTVYDTNSAAIFFVDTNGYFVVRDGTNGWTTITTTLGGDPATPVDTNVFTTIDVYLDYTNKIWRLNVNAVPLTNNIGFYNTSVSGHTGFEVYNDGTNTAITSYLDNIAIYDTNMLPAMSVSPSIMTNTSVYLAGATSQPFKVISSGDGQLNYYIITNSLASGCNLVITNNATGVLTNNATNTVWVRCDIPSLAPGVYSNSFQVISTNLEGQSQTVQLFINVYSLSVSPANLTNTVLYGNNATSQTFNVSAGGGEISFSVATNASWLNVSPSSGHVSSGTTNVLTNTYLTAGLAPGDYEGRVTVTTAEGGGSTGTVNVAMRVLATPVLGVSPFQIRQVVDKGGNPTSEYFDVWNASAPPVVRLAYQISVTSGSNIIQGVSPSSGICSNQHNTIGIYFNNLSGFDSGTYTAVLAVVATNYGSGYEGHWTTTSNITVELVISAPDAPAEVTATKGDYEDRVRVSWRPALSPLGGTVTYNVLRYNTFDPNYAQTIVSGLTVTNYDDTTVSPGVKYYYWVRSVNTYGQAGSNSVYDSGYRRLAAPGGLFASDGAYTNKVAVSWATVDGASSYYVYRSAGGAASIVYNTAGTSYDDLTIAESIVYTYYVQASNSICGSVLSAGETGYVLSRPTVLSASDGQYVGKIVLTWSAVPGATAYEIWKSTKTLTPPYGGGAKIAETASGSYSDTSVTAGTKYYYWLKSKNATALSDFSSREEGYAATAAVDLSLWALVLQPRRIGLGANPKVISFRLANNGGAALSGDNGTVQLAFYASANDVFGDADDQALGTVDKQITLPIGSAERFAVGGGNVTLPSTAGSYYIFMSLNPTWPSTLAPANASGWTTRRAQALEVSAGGTINYQALNDYDGDGISDLVVYTNGLWDARSVDGFEIARNAAFGGKKDAVVMGDYDGDSLTDPVIYDESRGLWQGLFSASGYTYGSGYFGGPGYGPVPGDYDGDGKTDLALYYPANALWYAQKAQGGRIIWGTQFGDLGYEPVIGDYDGDGKWDLALYNENSGLWYVRSVSGALILTAGSWGGPGFRPVPGDYDGDGLWDFAVFNKSTGGWYIINIFAEIIANGLPWGLPGYMPVIGDFDGDGISDMAIYNSTTGKWYIRTVAGLYLVLGDTWGGAGRKAVGEVE